MKRLDEVLKQLEEAEKEYKEKCLKYGIEEKTRKKKEVVEVVETTEVVPTDTIEQTCEN